GGITNVANDSYTATVLLLNSTIANNTVSSTSQIYSGRSYGGTGQAIVRFRNTIISGSGTRPNLLAGSGGTFVTEGHNLSSDSGGGFLTDPDDVTNTNPLLGPLQDNGGPTPTHGPLACSPALNAGDPHQLVRP